MPDADKPLNARQAALIAALLTCKTLKGACERSGVPERTALRYQKLPEFRRAYREARARVVEQAVARLQGLTGRAVSTLRRLLDSTNPSVAVRAAQLILENAYAGAKLLDQEERLAELERLAAEEGKTR